MKQAPPATTAQPTPSREQVISQETVRINLLEIPVKQLAPYEDRLTPLGDSHANAARVLAELITNGTLILPRSAHELYQKFITDYHTFAYKMLLLQFFDLLKNAGGEINGQSLAMLKKIVNYHDDIWNNASPKLRTLLNFSLNRWLPILTIDKQYLQFPKLVSIIIQRLLETFNKVGSEKTTIADIYNILKKDLKDSLNNCQNLLEQLQLDQTPGLKTIFIGDDLADRGNMPDSVMLALFNRLTTLGHDLSVTFSNHTLEFLRHAPKLFEGEFTENALGENQSRSQYLLAACITHGIINKEELEQLKIWYQNYLNKNLVLAEYANSPFGPTYFWHAPAFLETIEAIDPKAAVSNPKLSPELIHHLNQRFRKWCRLDLLFNTHDLGTDNSMSKTIPIEKALFRSIMQRSDNCLYTNQKEIWGIMSKYDPTSSYSSYAPNSATFFHGHEGKIHPIEIAQSRIMTILEFINMMNNPSNLDRDNDSIKFNGLLFSAVMNFSRAIDHHQHVYLDAINSFHTKYKINVILARAMSSLREVSIAAPDFIETFKNIIQCVNRIIASNDKNQLTRYNDLMLKLIEDFEEQLASSLPQCGKFDPTDLQAVIFDAKKLSNTIKKHRHQATSACQSIIRIANSKQYSSIFNAENYPRLPLLIVSAMQWDFVKGTLMPVYGQALRDTHHENIIMIINHLTTITAETLSKPLDCSALLESPLCPSAFNIFKEGVRDYLHSIFDQELTKKYIAHGGTTYKDEILASVIENLRIDIRVICIKLCKPIDEKLTFKLLNTLISKIVKLTEAVQFLIRLDGISLQPPPEEKLNELIKSKIDAISMDSTNRPTPKKLLPKTARMSKISNIKFSSASELESITLAGEIREKLAPITQHLQSNPNEDINDTLSFLYTLLGDLDSKPSNKMTLLKIYALLHRLHKQLSEHKFPIKRPFINRPMPKNASLPTSQDNSELLLQILNQQYLTQTQFEQLSPSLQGALKQRLQFEPAGDTPCDTNLLDNIINLENGLGKRLFDHCDENFMVQHFQRLLGPGLTPLNSTASKARSYSQMWAPAPTSNSSGPPPVPPKPSSMRRPGSGAD